MQEPNPDVSSLVQAETHPRLRELLRPTTLIRSHRLDESLGAEVLLASETFQHTGSFKFRAAYNVAASVAQPRLLTASSGNFGQALAYACRLLGKSCTVVMPATSVQVKVEAVRGYGGRVELVDVRVKSRAARVAELAREDPDAYVASAYDDPLVIAGNATLGEELGELEPLPEAIVVPVGGGGIISGVVEGLTRAGRRVEVLGTEPALGNDAARSLRAGRIVRNEQEPATLADGARTLSVGEHNWAIIRQAVSHIVEVPEEKIATAVRLLFELVNLKVEPTGALAVAALLTEPERFRRRRVGCVVTGGNADPELYRRLLAGEAS